MKIINWQVKTAAVLIAISVILYLAFSLTFQKDAHHIFEEVFAHIAFLPIHVLIITLIIHGLLNVREKRAMLKKLNMVIGTFYGEIGTDLLALLLNFDRNPKRISEILLVENGWSDRQFKAARKSVGEFRIEIDARDANLDELRTFLHEKQVFLLRLLENPNLLEHDAFTDLLWAVFHLADELNHRDDLNELPVTDYSHLSGDIRRAYIALIMEWLPYMKHLKEMYPYLFSLAVRSNPFDADASITVNE
ncbi:MAG: hypothetical protein GY771_17620 [bacterium]|nr:hypothetical protein [bacterium]